MKDKNESQGRCLTESGQNSELQRKNHMPMNGYMAAEAILPSSSIAYELVSAGCYIILLNFQLTDGECQLL